MTKKSKLYTKTGDKGKTSLLDGTLILKSDYRVELYGDLDELNSWIGLVKTMIKEAETNKNEFLFLTKVQSLIFHMGSNFACVSRERENYNLNQINNTHLKELEKEIDTLDSTLPSLNNFILPGGNSTSAHIHICRAICRRIERKMVHYETMNEEEVPANSLAFINRLSDYFFVLARKTNMDDQNCIETIVTKN